MELVQPHCQPIFIFIASTILLGCFKKSDHVDTVNALCIDVGSPPIVEDRCHYCR